MANYLTQFSFVVPVDDPRAAVAAITAADDALANGEPQDIFDPEDAGVPCVLVDEGPIPGVWITDDGGESSIESVIAVCRFLVSQPGSEDTIGFEWASTCSRPIADDAFGGGAAVVTRDTALIKHTGEVIDELLAQAKVGASGGVDG